MDISVDTDEELTPAQLRERYEGASTNQNRVHVPGADADRSGFDDVVKDQMKKRAKTQDPKGKGREKAEKFKF